MDSAVSVMRAVGIGAAIVLIWGELSGLPGAGGQERAPWLTGPAMHKQLGMVVPSAFGSDTPLRRAIGGISRSWRIAVLLDRRVDPDQTLDLTLHHVSLEELLGRIAEDRGLGMTTLGPVVYLGLPETGARLRTLSLLLHQQVQRLPGDATRRLLAAEPMEWTDFSTPKELLRGLASGGQLKLVGLEQVPHDLWAAADLPPLDLVDRLLLVAVQFDLTLEIAPTGTLASLVPLPEHVAIVKEYPGGQKPEELAAKWAAIAPDAEIEVTGEKILVRGLVEDHERIGGARRPASRPASKAGKASPREARYTIVTRTGPLDRTIRDLATTLRVEVKFDRKALEAAGVSLSQSVSLNVEEATIAEIFRALLEPAGCTFRRRGNVIEILPAR